MGADESARDIRLAFLYDALWELPDSGPDIGGSVLGASQNVFRRAGMETFCVHGVLCRSGRNREMPDGGHVL